MTAWYTCPQGHRWESALEPAPASAEPTCPVCGAQAKETMSEGAQGTAQQVPQDFLETLVPAAAARQALLAVQHTLVEGGFAPDEVPPEEPEGAPAVPAALADLPGYDILAEVGRGSMGVVFKARQVKLNRLVALKMILGGDLVGADGLARFTAEAGAVARLRHPNIVQIYEIGEHGGIPFISLEFVNGGSLADVVKGTPQLPAEAAKLVRVLAEAMHYAHENGVVHRDLKPANILLADSQDTQALSNISNGAARSKTSHGSSSNPHCALGIPKIADFGLAKQLDNASGLTATGSILGTPSYMAPEQASGKVRDIGPASDVYSLGAILYEMLAGRPPFLAATVVETLDQVRSLEPVSLRKLQSKLPADLETICLKCLQKEVGKRYASALDLAEDLRRFLAGEPILARPVSASERAIRWMRRNPSTASLVAGVVLMALVGLAGIVWQWRKAVANEQIANQLTADAQEKAKEERWERYRGNMAMVASAFEHQNFDAARRALEFAPKPHRGWEWRHYASTLDGALSVLQLGKKDVVYCPFFAVHPKLWQLALLAPDGGVRWWDPTSGPPFTSAESAPQGSTPSDFMPPARQLVYSPDGKRLAVAAADREIHIWDVETGQRVARLRGHQKPVTQLVFSPDGSRLASGGDDLEVRVWDVQAGTALYARKNAVKCEGLAITPDGTRLLIAAGKEIVAIDLGLNKRVVAFEGHRITIADFAISPDGERLASAGGDPENEIRLWDLATGKLLHVLKGHKDDIQVLAFSPDGTRLASSSWDHTVRLWDGKSGQPIRVLTGHTAQVYGLTFSPDGTRLLSGSTDETARLWDGKTGDLRAVLRGHRAAVADVAFRSDGKTIVTAALDGTLRIWDRELAESSLLRGHSRFVFDVAIHPDGKHAASVAWGGHLRYWDLDTGRQVRPMKHPGDVVSSVAFDADGRRMVTLSRFADQNHLGRALTIWDTATGTVLRAIPLAQGTSKDSRAVFNVKGDLVAVGDSEGPVRLFDPGTGEERAVLDGHQSGVLDVAFRPDGGQLASGGADGSVRLWDPMGRTEIAALLGHKSDVHRVAYSLDGSLLASASTDKTVRLWDAATYQMLAELPHGSIIYGLCFSPDGTRLATGCADKTIRLWDVGKRQEVGELRGHEMYVHAVVFSPDGTRLISSSGDSTLRVWDTLTAVERAKRLSSEKK